MAEETEPTAATTPEATPGAAITGAEVDALLDKGEDAGAADGTPRPYDLVAQDRIVRGRMPVLDRLNERWVNEFQRRLGDVIRTPIEVTLQEVQLTPYGNWLAALPVPTSFNLYTVKPWPRNALVAVEGGLLFTLVNAYYGGTRPPPSAARETLTQTEQRLNKIVIDLLTDLFRRALSPVATLDFQHAQSETNPNFVNMATPSETVVVTRVVVSLKEAGGSIALILPLSSFDPVRDKLAEGLKAVSAETRQRWYQGLKAQLEHTHLDLTSVFLEMEVSMRELLQMKPGDILPIEMPKTALLRSGSRPLLRGKFGLSRGYNAVSVLEAVKSVPHAEGEVQ
jgi:flagellar motor switch protein FliM